MYLLTNSFLGNKLEINKILKISLIYGISCFFIKNYFDNGIGTVLIFLLCTVLFYIVSQFNIISCFIAFSLSYGIKFVSEFAIVMTCSMYGLTIGEILDNQVLKILFCCITLVIPFIISIINSKKKINILNVSKTRNKPVEKKKIIIYVLILVGIVNILIMIGLVVISNMNSYKLFSRYETLLILLVIFSVLCVTALIFIVLILDKNKDIVQLEKSLIANNLKQMEETIDLLRTQKHDYMNHLQVILMQISNNKNEDARRYILGLAEDVNNIGIVFNTGSNYIDAILNFKNRKCLDYHIQLTACIDSTLEKTNLDDTQLSSMFLNIIDNAIDELKKCKKEYKYIHVDTYIEDSKHIISIKNNGSKINDINRIFDMGVSSKGENRGYGLYSIKQTLLKNKSNIYVISDEEETEFIIEIPIERFRYEAVVDI